MPPVRMLPAIPALFMGAVLLMGGGRGLITYLVQEGKPRQLTLAELLQEPPGERWVRIEGCLPEWSRGWVESGGRTGARAHLPLRAAAGGAPRLVLVSRDARLVTLLRWKSDNPGDHNLAGILRRHPEWQGPLTLEGVLRDTDEDEARSLGQPSFALEHERGPGAGSAVAFLLGLVLLLSTWCVAHSRRSGPRASRQPPGASLEPPPKGSS